MVGEDAGPSFPLQGSNPSIELTCPGEPGHAAHVERSGVMRKVARWGPLVIAALATLAFHTWYLIFMLRGDAPFFSANSLQVALVASLRDLPATVFMFIPAWLPALVPSKWFRLQRWTTLICGAVSIAIAASFAVVVAVHRDYASLAVVALFAAVGALHLHLPLVRRTAKAAPHAA